MFRRLIFQCFALAGKISNTFNSFVWSQIDTDYWLISDDHVSMTEMWGTECILLNYVVQLNYLLSRLFDPVPAQSAFPSPKKANRTKDWEVLTLWSADIILRLPSRFRRYIRVPWPNNIAKFDWDVLGSVPEDYVVVDLNTQQPQIPLLSSPGAGEVRSTVVDTTSWQWPWICSCKQFYKWGEKSQLVKREAGKIVVVHGWPAKMIDVTANWY